MKFQQKTKTIVVASLTLLMSHIPNIALAEVALHNLELAKKALESTQN